MTLMIRSTERKGGGAGALSALGRSAGSATLILSSLADGAKHGYALTKDIEAFAGVRLAPGTLYEALGRLEGQGLIEAVESHDRRRCRGPSSPPRRSTTRGRRRTGPVGGHVGDRVSPPGDAAERRARRLLRWYPTSWRGRFGDEFTELLISEFEEQPRSWRRTANVVSSGTL